MKKRRKLSKEPFEYPFKHRFTFVKEECSYYEGTVINVSEKFNKKKAFYYACAKFDELYPKSENVAVFYGEIDSPDVKDTLYKSYSQFRVKKKRGIFARH